MGGERQRVLHDSRVANGRETQTIVRQKEGGEPEKLVDSGYNPAARPDETTLVYVRSTRTGPGDDEKDARPSGRRL